MFSIDLLRERISELHELEDFEVISNKMKNIFHDLIYTGDTLYIAVNGTEPVLSSHTMAGQGSERFLRLFSHEEIAQAYLSKHNEHTIQKVSIIETVQLAKTYFIKGGFGFVLNEGDKWIIIPFADYLETFFKRIQCEDEMFNKDCADLIAFLNELDTEDPFRYSVLIRNSEWAEINGECIIFSKDTDISMIIDENNTLQPQPIGIQDLYDIKNASVVCILSGDKAIKTTGKFILAALDYCGRSQNQSEVLEDVVDWHTKDVSINFNFKIENETEADNEVESIVNDDIAFNDEETLSDEKPNEVILDEEPISKVNLSNIQANIKNKTDEFVQSIKCGLGKFRKNKPESKNSLETVVEEDDSPVDIISDDSIVEDIEHEKKKFKKNKGLLKHIFQVKTLITFLLIVLLLTSAIFFVNESRKNSKAFEQFCSYVETCEFGNAYVLYNEFDFSKEADRCLSEKLDALVLSYASDKIRIEELRASMQSLSNFPSMQQEIEVAKLVTSKLEASKNAYKKGNESDSIYDKLDVWRQVIELDSVNYSVVQETVKNNQTIYEAEIEKDLEYYSTRIRDFAKARYEVLAYWYPDSNLTHEWEDKYKSDNSSLLSIYPIAVYNIEIRQGPDSYWTLYIDWKNKSVKRIKSIRFSLVSLDENGEIVTCSDFQGKWTVFDAVDPHEYEPGEGSYNKDYKWEKAFYGSFVAAVKLTGIYIEYTDGSTSSYTDEQALLQMQS